MIKKLIFLSLFFFSHLIGSPLECPAPLPPLPQLPVPAVIPPPVATCETPTPTIVPNYIPVTFVNNTGLDASEIFIVVLVNSSTQYLTFSGSPHVVASRASFTPNTYISSAQYSFPLSSFENIATDTYTFYLPNDGNNGDPNTQVMTSSRILISLKQPLTYFINNIGVVQFPSEFDVTNDNYFILNDKIEFDLGSNQLNRLNLNLTGVDFFGLPLLVQANYKFLYGTTYSDACAVTGMPTSKSLSEVITAYKSALSSLESPFDTYWGGLVASYTNPTSAGGAVCDLRIFAPATAMGSTQTQSNPTKISFPTDYFLSSAYSPDTCSWFNAVWSGTTQGGDQAYYQNRKPIPYLVLDATTKSGAATAKGYETNDQNFSFVISGGVDAGKTLVIPKPQSSKAFFTGAVSDYSPAITGSASAATIDQVFKVFATSIISGFFPINCQYPTPVTINNTYVQNHSSSYFENNDLLQEALSTCPCVSNVPWYDFYSRTLLTIGSPNLFYTSAYSDFLGTDGTIVIVNPNTNNADATLTVNLGDCTTDINFPNPYGDTTLYNITVNVPSNVTVQFATSSGGPFGVIPATANGNTFFLKVTYNTGIYSGLSFVTQVAPEAQIYHPILPGQGVIITSGTQTTVNLGASPAN